MSTVLKIRRQLRQLRRAVVDRPQAHAWQARTAPHTDWPEQLALTQVIKPSSTTQAKVHNIQLACAHFNDRLWAPGQTFVFWHLVGEPTRAAGFQAGRSLLGGALVEDLGGGLCQLAGGLYHLALQGGLEIVERHNHTVDLYTEDRRYTPLGADAAVAWAFKDLRLRNTLQQPLSWRVSLAPAEIRFALHARDPIPPCQVDFERHPDGAQGRRVTTWRSKGRARQQVNVSKYTVAKVDQPIHPTGKGSPLSPSKGRSPGAALG